MKKLNADEKREVVRKNYAKVAEQGGLSCGCTPLEDTRNEAASCCAPATSCCAPASLSHAPSTSCCGPVVDDLQQLSKMLGYAADDLKDIPDGANMGLGCGNPHAIAALKPGEVVLDLGSGGGFDCFLAARQVGETGRVIGVDMTPEMVSKARDNARKGGFENVEFRLGEIENLPVADEFVDVIMSNCVINLSPDKPRVFHEMYRALKSGGRLSISDAVATAQLPEQMKNDIALLSACIAGAATVDEIETMLREAGFENICILPKEESRDLISQWQPGKKVEDYVLSATIEATKK